MSSATPRDRELHALLLDGDAGAVGRAFAEYLVPVLTKVRRWRTEIRDETLIYDAVVDSIASYCREPRKYDPDRLPLTAYLAMDANGDVRHRRDREHARAVRLVPIGPVEDDGSGRNSYREPGEEDDIDLDRLSLTPRMIEAARGALDTFSDQDRQLVLLILDNEGHTSRYSTILGIDHLPFEEQQRVVKRHKDRLKKGLERLGVRLRAQIS